MSNVYYSEQTKRSMSEKPYLCISRARLKTELIASYTLTSIKSSITIKYLINKCILYKRNFSFTAFELGLVREDSTDCQLHPRSTITN